MTTANERPSAAEFAVDSPDVQVVLAGRAPALAYAVAVVLFLVWPTLDGSQKVAMAWLGVATALLVVGSLLAYRRVRRARGRAAQVRLSQGRLEVIRAKRRAVFRLPAVPQGWTARGDDGPRATLVVHGGHRISVAVTDRARARTLLEAAGVRPDRHAIQVELSEAGPWTWWLRHRQTVLFCAALLAVPVALVLGGDVRWAFPIGAVWFATSLLWAAIRPKKPTITVGADGILLDGAGHRSFFRYDQVADVRGAHRGVDVVLKDGRRMHLPLGKDLRDDVPLASIPALGSEPEAKRACLLEQVRLMLAHHRQEQRAAKLALLDRQGRSLGDWRRAARTVLVAGYRRGALAAAAVADVLDDPTASAERRIGAALALKGLEEPAIRQRTRIAVDRCADPKLRVALEHALSDELDEPEMDRLLESEQRGTEKR